MPNGPAHIRAAHREDVPTLCAIIRHAFRDVAQRFGLNFENCPKHPSNYTVLRAEDDFSRGVAYFLLEVEGQPLGCAALESAADDLCYLERLAVLPHARGHGYGAALAKHLLQAAAAQGCQRVSIGIIADQTELKQWYRHIGFEPGETKTFPHLPFSVTFMTYRIR